MENFKLRVPSFSESFLINEDFFKLELTFDLIVEQTFFCAINPSLRSAYVSKVHDLLNSNGKLVGLLFDDPLNNDKPPYGGCKSDYIEYFESYFILTVMETCYNSIENRRGKELFFKIKKLTNS